MKMLNLLVIGFATLIAIGCGGGSSDVVTDTSSFKLQIDTTKDSDKNFTIQKRGSYVYDYNIDCDSDGNLEATDQTGDYTCEYATDGIYTITITGDYPSIKFDKPKMVIDVKQWGNQVWKSFKSAFKDCENLENFSATDTPNLSQVTSLESTFANAKKFNANINNWDVSNVVSLSQTFKDCFAFNQPLNNWKVDNVTVMVYTLAGCKVFNQPLNNWKVDNVTNMFGMFWGDNEFDQPLSNWNVSKVKNMSYMFYGVDKFNQDIGDWNVSSVEYMGNMFKNASLFSGNVENWALNTANVKNMDGMFYNASSFSNHNLSGWDVSNVTSHSNFCKDWGSGNTTPGGWTCP